MQKLWEVQLKSSYLGAIFIILFFISLMAMLIYASKDTEIENTLTVFCFYLSLTTLKNITISRKNKGWIAVFTDTSIIYWKKQRFKMVRFPFLSQYIIILCLKSVIQKHSTTVFIFRPQMNSKSWRSFHFILQALIYQTKKNANQSRSHRID